MKLSKNLLIELPLIFLLTFGVYLTNLHIDYRKDLNNGLVRRLLPSQDAIPNTFLPYLLVKEKTLYFDPIIKTIKTLSNNRPYFLIKTEKGYYSAYPILTGILAVPAYLIPLLLNKIPELTYHENILKILLLGRVTASFYAALSTVLFYLIIRKNSKYTRWNLIFTIFYALGTCTWSVASRGLWQHTTAQFFNSLVVLVLLYSVKKPKLIPWVGFLLGLAVLVRPTNIALALVISIYAFFNQRKYLKGYILGTIPSIAFLLIHNYLAFGSPLMEGYGARNDFNWSTSWLTSLPAYAISPARSFLFVSPPLILAYVAVIQQLRENLSGVRGANSEHNPQGGRDNHIVYRYLGVGFILSLLMFCKWYTWDGAPAFGYRMLVDFLPIVGLLAFDVTKNFGKKGKIIIALLICYSIYVQGNAVIYRKSRCGKDHTWTIYCLLPPKEKAQY